MSEMSKLVSIICWIVVVVFAVDAILVDNANHKKNIPELEKEQYHE